MDSEQEWLPKMDEKFLPAEEPKVEKGLLFLMQWHAKSDSIQPIIMVSKRKVSNEAFLFVFPIFLSSYSFEIQEALNLFVKSIKTIANKIYNFAT